MSILFYNSGLFANVVSPEWKYLQNLDKDPDDSNSKYAGHGGIMWDSNPGLVFEDANDIKTCPLVFSETEDEGGEDERSSAVCPISIRTIKKLEEEKQKEAENLNLKNE